MEQLCALSATIDYTRVLKTNIHVSSTLQLLPYQTCRLLHPCVDGRVVVGCSYIKQQREIKQVRFLPCPASLFLSPRQKKYTYIMLPPSLCTPTSTSLLRQLCFRHISYRYTFSRATRRETLSSFTMARKFFVGGNFKM